MKTYAFIPQKVKSSIYNYLLCKVIIFIITLMIRYGLNTFMRMSVLL